MRTNTMPVAFFGLLLALMGQARGHRNVMGYPIPAIDLFYRSTGGYGGYYNAGYGYYPSYSATPGQPPAYGVSPPAYHFPPISRQSPSPIPSPSPLFGPSSSPSPTPFPGTSSSPIPLSPPAPAKTTCHAANCAACGDTGSVCTQCIPGFFLKGEANATHDTTACFDCSPLRCPSTCESYVGCLVCTMPYTELKQLQPGNAEGIPCGPDTLFRTPCPYVCAPITTLCKIPNCDSCVNGFPPGKACETCVPGSIKYPVPLVGAPWYVENSCVKCSDLRCAPGSCYEGLGCIQCLTGNLLNYYRPPGSTSLQCGPTPAYKSECPYECPA